MSDSNFSKLCEWKKVHEVVDEAWAEDCLSDDEVELPAGETFGDEGAHPQRRIINIGSADEHHTYLLLSSVAMTTFSITKIAEDPLYIEHTHDHQVLPRP